jgi:small subunit ribosomal protein S11
VKIREIRGHLLSRICKEPAMSEPTEKTEKKEAKPVKEKDAKAAAPADGAAPAAAAATAPVKRTAKRTIPLGRASVLATFNNTMVSITDPDGNVLSWSTGGAEGFKGTRKGTPYAAQMAASNAARKAKDYGLREIDVIVSGPGAGRESAVRALQMAGLNIRTIKDMTPIPHNGCRPRKRRRV